MITKIQLVAALNVAKDAQGKIDAANAAKDSALSQLVAVTAERDSFKVANDILTDPEVVDLVESLAPTAPVE